MARANRPAGEDLPAVRRARTTATPTMEATLALALCAIVLLASMALLGRTSDYSRALEELQADSLRLRPREERVVRPPQRTEPRPELVVLLSLDGLRQDRLELPDELRAVAPNLRALGREGVVFRTVAAQSSQPLVSHKSLLTGKYPATLMLEETGADLLDLVALRAPRAYLETTFVRVEGQLAAALSAQGYRTAAFTDGEWTRRAHGLAAGFERFEDDTGGFARSVQRALEWLDTQRGSPSFLFLQTSALACPYASGAETDAFCPDHEAHGALEGLCGARGPLELPAAGRQALVDHYDGAVHALDRAFGALLDGLRTRELLERALLVVTSAHGESLGERGQVGHGGLHPEELLVPLVLRFPPAWSISPSIVDEPAERVDLFPTLLALTACEIPPGLDGRSLVPTLLRGVRGREYLVAQTLYEGDRGGRASPALRTLLVPGRWQVIQDGELDVASFLALREDPSGAIAHPIGAEEFAPLLDLLLGDARGEPHAGLRLRDPIHFSAPLRAELEALGLGGPTLAGSGHASDLR